MKIFLSFTFSLFFIGLTFSQEHTVRGFIYDKKNGEPIIFEKVLLLKVDSTIFGGGNTDVNGFFAIPKVDKGNYILKIDNGNFKRFYENMSILDGKGFTNVKYELEKSENINELQDVVVSAERTKKKN